MKTKQVIVWRADVKTASGHKLRSGKLMAQASHGAIGSCFSLGERVGNKIIFDLDKHPYLLNWFETGETKIVLQCKDEKGLVEIFQKAKQAGLPCRLITDAGRTEFNGVPTKTCIGIGPAWVEDIDKITGELETY